MVRRKDEEYLVMLVVGWDEVGNAREVSDGLGISKSPVTEEGKAQLAQILMEDASVEYDEEELIQSMSVLENTLGWEVFIQYDEEQPIQVAALVFHDDIENLKDTLANMAGALL